MDDKVIKIHLSIFLNRYNNIKVSDNIINKAEELRKTCSCFNSLYDPKMIWEKKLFNKREKNGLIGTNINNNKGKVHIIIPDFSDISNMKRTLVGYLNKLTVRNKDVIYEKIKGVIVDNSPEEVFLIIWSYIKCSSSDIYIYIKLLDYFDNRFLEDIIDKLWKNYLNDKEWLPPIYIYNNNLLLLNNEYELYCDYIKWKRGIHNLNIMWIKYKKGNEISLLLNDVFDNMVECINNPNIHKYIIDIFMEQILKILNNHKDASIINKIKSLDIKNFDSSTKFLIYNIIENK
jgi:hypothetical protein